jgi:CRP/FNR family transcriptional regulator
MIPAQEFRERLSLDHNLCLQLLKSMSLRMRQLLGHVEGIVLKEARNRVAHYLVQEHQKQGAEFSLPSFKKHLACHLNLTSETLSRVLRQLREEGFISETKKTQFSITHLDGLKEIALE